MAFLPVTRRDGTITAYARVDDADAEALGQHAWRLTPQGYVRRGIGQEQVFLHRVLCPTDAETVDHINRDRLDNRRDNLRPATYRLNNVNKRPSIPNRTGLPQGVGQLSTGGFRARFMHRHLGVYPTPELAGEAYASAREGWLRSH